jgi:hypothetical protein
MERVENGAAFVVVAIASLWCGSAMACSCVSRVKEDRAEVRDGIRELLELGANVVLLRAVEVTQVGRYHEQAVLRVVESWKGEYPVGASVRSDTDGMGSGDCSSPIKVGEEILLSFETQPIHIYACPSDFVLTRMERYYLDRFARSRAFRGSGAAK